MGNELQIILILAVGLGLSTILGCLARRLKLSPILGYLLAGYLVGPASPGFVADPTISEQLAGIGITLLMFAVGLSFNWKDLIAVKNLALPGAIILSTFSIIAGTLFSMYLGEVFISGFVVGLAICVSSTVVMVRVLTDQGLLQTKQGHIVIGWTIVEDLISVFGLLLLPSLVSANFASDQGAFGFFYPFLWVSLKIGALGLFVHFFGETLIERLLKIVARTRSHELFTLAVLSCVFLIAIGSSYLFGVSLALGAFIAGTIVGKTDMSHQAAANALPMRDAFAVIFFLSVGMLFSPMTVANNLPLFFGVLLILILFRPILAFIIVKIARYPTQVAITVALAIAQIGEYSFILAEEGSQLGILPDNAYDILIACAFITIGLNPILFQLFPFLYGNRSRAPELSSDSGNSSFDLLQDLKTDSQSFLPKAIVVGFGPVGQEVSKHLINQGYHALVIDQNIDTISSLKGGNLQTIYGDATQFHILEKAQIENTPLLIITIPDLVTTQFIILTARNINPFIKIIARVRFSGSLTGPQYNDIITVSDEEASAEKFIPVVKAQLQELQLHL